jgi:hypothetical protein
MGEPAGAAESLLLMRCPSRETACWLRKAACLLRLWEVDGGITSVRRPVDLLDVAHDPQRETFLFYLGHSR